MHQLLTPNETCDILPLSPYGKSFIASTRHQLKKIITGKDHRKVFVVGPCSIHDIEKAYEYAKELKKLAEEVKGNILIVMRTHFEKPRTKFGWKGLIYDPKLDGSNDIQLGILKARRLLLELADIGLPVSSEILDPYIYSYYEDLLSYAMIGARTCTSQTHRQIASLTQLPVGIKNTIDGNIEAAIHAVAFARTSHTFISPNGDGKLMPVETKGNQNTHIILRGACTHHNFDSQSIQFASAKLNENEVPNRIMIDCSHGNKKEGGQSASFLETISMMQNPKSPIFGLMLESYLKSGKYRGGDLKEAPKDLSITDHCISLEETKELILAANQSLSQSFTIGLNSNSYSST
ncbi:MAG: 3-deoxy-7-phosphoheptulonate synthase [Rhabdochlamydiaceae bacterium]|nr:3-deoxy-7-phosphoheptulonate synthase [Candidatus Amphrikana amoebophyrae]